MRDPFSVRWSTTVIAAATLVSVVIGGVLITVLDREEFPDLGSGLWWALQTVTTVGYGDVTPANPAGRLVGSVFMLEALAFMTIVTAVITSGYVERRRQQQRGQALGDAVGVEELTAQLADLTSRIDRLQRTIDAATAGQVASVSGQQVLQHGDGDRPHQHQHGVDDRAEA
jgi:voltage-gated potassium channel